MIRRRILLLAALAVSACDVPTALPMLEQTWVVPGEDIVVDVAEVLPAGVTVSEDRSAFLVPVDGASLVTTLAEMCSDCVAAHGQMAPKPAFTHSFATTTSLPGSLVSAYLTGEAFAVELAHSLNFDLLRPSTDSGAEVGYIVVEVTSAGAVVSRDSVSGADVAFDSTVVLTPSLPIRPTDVSGALDVAVVVHSPAGDSVLIDASDTLGIQVHPTTLTLSEATVEAGSIEINTTAGELEAALDSALIRSVRSGALRLQVANPFGIEGTLQLDFDLGDRSIRKSVTLAAGTSTREVDFSRAELQDLLAADRVTVSAEGTLAAPDGTITVEPGDALVLESAFELVILIGGTEEEG